MPDKSNEELETKISSAQRVEDQVMLRIKLIEELDASEIERKEQLLEEASQIAQKAKNQFWIAKIIQVKGVLYNNRQLYNEALQLLQTSSQKFLVLKEENELYSTYNLIGIIHRKLSNYHHALKYYYLNEKILEKDQDEQLLAQTKANIATVYLKLEEYDTAFKYYQEALAIFQKLDHKIGIVNILNGLGIYHQRKQQYQLAEKHYSEALELLKTFTPSQKKGLGLTLEIHVAQNLGTINFYKNDYTKAKKHLTTALQLSTKTNNYYAIVNAQFALAQIVFNENKIEEAFQHLQLSSTIAEEKDFKDLQIQIYRFYARIYTQKEDYKKALQYYVKISDIEHIRYQQDLKKTQDRFKAQKELIETEEKIEQQKQDIEVKEKANQVLIQLNQTIQAQKKALEEKTEELRMANRELKNFAHVASHDMKEPLRMITSFGQFLVRTNKDNITKEGQEYLEFMIASSKRLSVMIDELLKYATIGVDVTQLVEVDMNGVVQIAQNNLQLKIKETQTHVLVEPLPKIQGHAILFTQLFQNLMANSIKFQQADQVPEIRIFAKEEKDKCTIVFQDNGIGISKENLPKIFGIFKRLHAREEFEGSGIGLATCKKIVERLGGHIEVESELGVGTTFYLSFPTNKETESLILSI